MENQKTASVHDPSRKIPEKCFDLILQHLNGADVKNFFVVSKSWSEVAGKSFNCMDKIKVKL
jgi:hypothetical protein